jgi:uncharacterized peroxidase-related enzyme
MIPNLYATLAKAPAALEVLLRANSALATGQLNAKEREIVALATSQANSCQYCLSAHTFLAKKAGLSLAETHQARAGKDDDPRHAAIARFTRSLIDARGHVEPRQLDEFKSAGLSDADLLEVVANVAVTTLTNFTNNVARTRIDFPVVETALAA